MSLTRTRGATLIMVAATLLMAGCDNNAKKKAAAAPAKPSPPEVVVMTVEPQRLPVEVEYAGRTAGSRDVEVRARVQGILIERTHVEGSRVQQGDVLFRIDPKPYEIALKRAQARLQEAEARLWAAEREWQRANALYQNRTISERARDDASAALDLAKANVALVHAEVSAAQIDLDYTTVEAPISGITDREALSEGSLLRAAPENSLLTRIIRLDPIHVNFAIPDAEWERQRRLVESGRLVSTTGKQLAANLRVANDLPYAHEGLVDFTSTTVDRATGTIQARAVFPNPRGVLLPGQFVRIMLKGLVRTDAIVVPEAAIMQGPQGTFVYRLTKDNNAQIAPVKTGPTVAEGWIVEEGLKPGDRVVVEGVIRVRPGQPVRIADAQMPPPAGTGSASGGRQKAETPR